MSSINKLIEYYSDWYRLKRAVAIMLRVRELLKERRLRSKARNLQQFTVDGKNQISKGIKPLPLVLPTTLKELKEAEDAIIRCVQAQSYGK